MKKFVNLECNVCKRQKTSAVDVTHLAPNNCTITLNCRGKLFPVDYTDSSVSKTDNASVTNWYAKSTVFETVAHTNNQYPVASGTLGQFVIAVKTTSSAASITLPFKTNQQVPTVFRKYTYYKGVGVTVISGKEDGTEKKTLNFTNTDFITVTVNGVSVSFDTWISNSSLPKNVIVLQTPLTNVSNQIDVTIAAAVTNPSVNLTFAKSVYDENRQGSGAWENVNSISLMNQDYKVFFLDASQYVNLLSLNLAYKLDATTISLSDGSSVAPTDVLLLLGTNPYTHVDRMVTSVVNLGQLDGKTKNLMLIQEQTRVLKYTELSVDDVFPIMRVNTFNPDAILATSTPTITNPSFTNSFIKGPGF